MIFGHFFLTSLNSKMDQDIFVKPKPCDLKKPEFLSDEGGSLISLSFLKLFKIENWLTLEQFFLGF